MAISIPARLRDEDFATCLVKRYLGRRGHRQEFSVLGCLTPGQHHQAT